MEEVKEFVFVDSVMQTWRDGRKNKRENCERQVCHKITCMGCERKKYVHEG